MNTIAIYETLRVSSGQIFPFCFPGYYGRFITQGGLTVATISKVPPVLRKRLLCIKQEQSPQGFIIDTLQGEQWV